MSRLERSIVLRLVAAVSLVGLMGVAELSVKPFDTLRVGWVDIDMANFDLLLETSACSSELEGDIDVL